MPEYPAEIAVEPWAGAPPKASVRVPGSKSLTNRALIVAALADGPSRLPGALDSDDTRVMVDALKALGLAVEHDRDAALITIEGLSYQDAADRRPPPPRRQRHPRHQERGHGDLEEEQHQVSGSRFSGFRHQVTG